MIPIEQILWVASTLLLLSIIASKTSGRLGVPALLIFLIIGMLAGSDGPGGIYFDDPWVAQFLGVLALTFILFSGGLDTNWKSIRPVLGKGLALSTLGVLGTALLLGYFAMLILGFSVTEGMLLGAIVSSTDAAAVFAVLRSKRVSLKEPLKPLLELESGSNDPMAVFLTTGFIHLLTQPHASVGDLIPMFFSQMIIGAAVGYGFGRGAVLLINRVRLEYEGLYPVLTLALVMLTYGLGTVLRGNGFLAVYIAGLVMGNHDFIHKRSLLRFHDGLAWLMQIIMFLTLGLLVFPSHLVPLIGSSLLVSLFLMFIARPASVYATLAIAKGTWREKIMVSWVGLRGAVPIILATFPLLTSIEKAEEIFNLVFFIVLTSVLVQGTSIPLVARWLKVDAPLPERTYQGMELAPSCNLKNEMLEIAVPPGSITVGKQILELALPKGSLVVLISRMNECFVPHGGTMIETGDSLLILGDKGDQEKIRALFERSAVE